MWSYSKLTLFLQCPLAYKYAYIDNLPRQDNVYAEIGTICHDIIEGWLKKEYMTWELADVFYEKFVSMQNKFPNEKIAEKYYQDLYRYFTYFNGFGELKPILVEKETVFNIGEHEFVGFPDFVALDNNENIIILDHKTSNIFKDIDDKMKQLYVYAEAVNKEFGKYPKYLGFNFIRFNKTIMNEFKNEKYQEVVKWINDTINKINNTVEFNSRYEEFYCKNLCNFRELCEYGGGVIDNASGIA